MVVLLEGGTELSLLACSVLVAVREQTPQLGMNSGCGGVPQPGLALVLARRARAGAAALVLGGLLLGREGANVAVLADVPLARVSSAASSCLASSAGEAVAIANAHLPGAQALLAVRGIERVVVVAVAASPALALALLAAAAASLASLAGVLVLHDAVLLPENAEALLLLGDVAHQALDVGKVIAVEIAAGAGPSLRRVLLR
mmetsp:Transcript_27782/g.51714  ORF Transcript_27782/g.51714 Transcript_27782/m.51714 type:complete len:202 (-) Transcript_27782:204-809(-)